MSSLVVSSNYRLVLPKNMTTNLGIRPGDKLHAIEYRGRITLIPVVNIRAYRGFLKDMNSTVERDADRPIT